MLVTINEQYEASCGSVYVEFVVDAKKECEEWDIEIINMRVKGSLNRGGTYGESYLTSEQEDAYYQNFEDKIEDGSIGKRLDQFVKYLRVKS